MKVGSRIQPMKCRSTRRRTEPPAPPVLLSAIARDAQGRTRTQQSYKWPPIRLAEILDPVAGVAYLLDDQKKIAHRMPLAPALAAQAPVAEDPQTTIQSFGSQLLEGVMTEGIRKIFRSSHGLTIETWESPELKIALLAKSSNGYSTRLTNLSRQRDPALFQPPRPTRLSRKQNRSR